MTEPVPQGTQQVPPAAVEAVFAKLLLVYGAGRLNAAYRDQDIGTVKRHWAHELRGLNPSDVAYGLTVLPPDFVPNVLQFKAACQRAPVEAFRAIAGPPASPERVKRALARFSELREALQRGGDPKAWAWKLLRRGEHGERIPSCHLRMARAALERELLALQSRASEGDQA